MIDRKKLSDQRSLYHKSDRKKWSYDQNDHCKMIVTIKTIQMFLTKNDRLERPKLIVKSTNNDRYDPINDHLRLIVKILRSTITLVIDRKNFPINDHFSDWS